MKWYEKKFENGKNKNKLIYTNLIKLLGTNKLKNMSKITISDIQNINETDLSNLNSYEIKKLAPKIINWANTRIENYKTIKPTLSGDTQAFAQKQDLLKQDKISINDKMSFGRLKHNFIKASHILRDKTATMEGFDEVISKFSDRMKNILQKNMRKKDYEKMSKQLDRNEYIDFWRLYNKITENGISQYDSNQVQSIVFKGMKQGKSYIQIKNMVEKKARKGYEEKTRKENSVDREFKESFFDIE